jgi:hypothetical protein
LRRGVQLKSLTPLIGGTTAPIFNTQFMEKILRIEEATFENMGCRYNVTFEGYQIITDKQTIKIGIENGQCCCEDWGFFMTEDDLTDFVNADLISVEVVDTALKVEKLKELRVEGCDTMFVNFNTTKGLLQFVAYNDHNGSYGHDAIIISEQVTNNVVL